MRIELEGHVNRPMGCNVSESQVFAHVLLC